MKKKVTVHRWVGGSKKAQNTLTYYRNGPLVCQNNWLEHKTYDHSQKIKFNGVTTIKTNAKNNAPKLFQKNAK